MQKDNKLIRVIKLVLNDIAEIYLYLLVFHFVSLILSFFFESWKLFFNWTAFHIGIVVLGILSLFSDRAKEVIFSEKNLARFKELSESVNEPFRSGLERTDPKPFLKKSYKIIKTAALLFFSFIAPKIQKLTKKDYLKIGLIIIILSYSLSKEMEVVEFLILFYALVSILFILESRIAAVIALAFLISCPFLLIFEKEAMAETMAIYAYYFLVITVITQIREYIKENRAKNTQKVIHS